MVSQALETGYVAGHRLIPGCPKVWVVVWQAATVGSQLLSPAFEQAGSACVVLEDVHPDSGKSQLLIGLIHFHTITTLYVHGPHCFSAEKLI